MDYITFLKKINELSEYEWSAKITERRDYFTIVQDGSVAIVYDNKYQDGIFTLFNLGCVKGKEIDLIYAFAQSKDPFNANEREEELMMKSEIVKTYDDEFETFRSVVIDNINSIIADNHAE